MKNSSNNLNLIWKRKGQNNKHETVKKTVDVGINKHDNLEFKVITIYRSDLKHKSQFVVSLLFV